MPNTLDIYTHHIAHAQIPRWIEQPSNAARRAGRKYIAGLQGKGCRELYDFGVLKLFGELSRERRVRDYAITPMGGSSPGIDLEGCLVGFTVSVGVGLIRGAYSQVRYDLHTPVSPNPKASKVALGYVHNLSKRTALYATVARISNKNGAALTINGGPAFVTSSGYSPGVATGYDVGVRHSF